MASYYTSLTGNNSNAGTAPNVAWRTMQFGLNTMTAGDFLNIGTGIWSENVNITKNGTAGNMYNIVGAGTGLTTQTINNLQIPRQYYLVSGIMFSGASLVLGDSNANATQSNFNIVQGCLFTHCVSQGCWLGYVLVDPSATGAPAYNIIHHNVFQNAMAPSQGMMRMAGHDNIVSGNIFIKNRGEDVIRVGGTGQTICCNLFSGINNPVYITGGIYSISSTGDEYAICTLTGNLWDYELDQSLGTVIVNGIYPASYNSSGGGNGAVLIGISPSGFRYITAGSGGGGGSPISPPSGFATDVSTGSIQGANHADCFQAFAGGTFLTTGIIFDRNTIVDSYTCQISNLEGEGTDSYVKDFTWSNNLILNSSMINNINIPYCKVFNNTAYNTTGHFRFLDIGRGHGYYAQVFNNIFLSCGPSGTNGGSFPYGFETVGVRSTSSGNFNLMSQGNNGVCTANDIPVVEQNGINGGYSPSQIFVNVNGNNFHLANGAICIGSGINLSYYFTDDIDGNLRSVPWDWGAYVYTIVSGVSGSARLVRMGRHPKFKAYHSF